MPWELSLRDFRAVLFDVDGTLVDSMAMLTMGLGDSIERISGSRPPDEAIRSLIGLPLTNQLRRYFPEPPSNESLALAVDYTIDRYGVHSSLERPFSSAITALKRCKEAGMGTALVTSKNSREMSAFMRRFTGSEYVDLTICSDDVARPKPHPDSAIAACNHFGIRPHEAVFVGDAIFDIECAHTAGMKAVAVAYGATPRKRLAELEPSMILDSPEELLEWCNTSFLNPKCPVKQP